MSRNRFIVLVVAALAAISAALYFSAQRNQPRDSQGGALLPTLAKDINTVSLVSVRKGSATPAVTIHKQTDQWTVAERADYPADVSKLKKLLLALRDAKIIEEKTSNPANFAQLGVDDPALPNATGAEISLTAQDGRHAVIIGKAAGEGNFARRSGENLSFIIEPGISFEAEPRDWIDSPLLDVPALTIQSIEMKPAAGDSYSVRRVTPTDPKFSIDGVPAGRKAADASLLGPSPTTYSALTADDVAPASGIDFTGATVAVVTLTDGNVITFTGTTSGDKHWIELKASKDAALSAKNAGRAFEITGYRYDAIFRPLEQLLVPKETPAASKVKAPASSRTPVLPRKGTPDSSPTP